MWPYVSSSPKVTLMSVYTSNSLYLRKLGKNTKVSKKRTLPISGQNLFPQWCPLIRDYTVDEIESKTVHNDEEGDRQRKKK